MYTIVFANQKGGVAKTTSAANLGAALAMRGRRVLLVDLDPQANLSEAFGVDDVQCADALGRAFVDDMLWPGGDVEPRRALWTDRPVGVMEEGCEKTEPLPAGHPFWAHPQITLTPHTSARTLRDESIAQIAGKIRALEAGHPIAGVVDAIRGY